MRIFKNWKELMNLENETETHTLKLTSLTGDKYPCSGHLIPKNKSKDWDDIAGRRIYLTTHTFYMETATQMFRNCGYDIILESWDNEVPLETEFTCIHVCTKLKRELIKGKVYKSYNVYTRHGKRHICVINELGNYKSYEFYRFKENTNA